MRGFFVAFGLGLAALSPIALPPALARAQDAGAATSTTFGSGSLIVPMDVDYQNAGSLRAFGLLYKLLLN
jgi:hypothetical protein